MSSEQFGQIPAEKTDVRGEGQPHWPEPFRVPKDAESEVRAEQLRAEHELRILRGYFALANSSDCDPDWLFEQVGFHIKMGACCLLEAIVEAHSLDKQQAVRDALHARRSANQLLEGWRLQCVQYALILFLSKLVTDKKKRVLPEGNEPLLNRSISFDDVALASPDIHELEAVA